MMATTMENSSSNNDTIVAIATPIVPQLGGVSIVRISGENAREIAKEIFEPTGKRKDCFQSHVVLHGTIVNNNDGEVIDEVLLLPMLKPRSYTAEDVVEIHTHGGSKSPPRRSENRGHHTKTGIPSLPDTVSKLEFKGRFEEISASLSRWCAFQLRKLKKENLHFSASA